MAVSFPNRDYDRPNSLSLRISTPKGFPNSRNKCNVAVVVNFSDYIVYLPIPLFINSASKVPPFLKISMKTSSGLVSESICCGSIDDAKV